jgi:hypothetical protein
LWLGIFNAAILQTINAYNYEQLNDTDLTPDEVAATCYGIYETYLSEECELCNCNCPDVLTRLTVNGVLETSIDGGITWTPAPGSDPRQTAMLFPPLSGEDGATKRCKAAENITTIFTGTMEQYADQLIAGADAAEIVAYILDAALLWFGVVAPLTAFAAAIAIEVVREGANAIYAAFDNNVWNRFRCNLYCHMPDDGRLTAGNITGIKAQIDIDETGITNLMLKAEIDMWGVNGLTNMGRTGAGTGEDCGGCGCDCETQQTYQAESEDFSGATPTYNGPYLGRVLTAASPLTLTIPDRDTRIVTGIFIGWTGAGGSGALTATCNSIDSVESPVTRTGSESPSHSWATGQSDDTVSIQVTGTLNYHVDFVIVFYGC